MGHVILITGGCRSGKSAFAQQLAEETGDQLLFLATSPPLDREMQERIRLHREERAHRGWQTVEEQQCPARIIRESPPGATILLDCLTLWINNMLYLAEKEGKLLDEKTVRGKAEELLLTCRERPGTVIMVTNEVGLGIVPENRLARRYRDLVGRCNQCIGREADEVYLVSCGVPLKLKG
ncbi:adenosylcobinamide kinase/adenosylcobinamide phosphate guanyltransferase [Desulfolithobacter dissulfuricans]|uniref:Adenosylcobinamide kinase n=1 Tax=Desulfolithobacter dissulfuricans TaxID=2795293 RepID=A0A915U277_9BACT|nr:bifunctional adenosylcobinamide kinase/adenosylcobinamide-phosphate guanylyltransferase [Desulfolithobacter dissulfuricans]BCO09167.1 adenosylcobinamide kinase/adenosylcobinamide phosphate guanyltransferase [Desulfolithobacter dissulfuricans]